MPEWTTISSLPTVECPVCHQLVPLGIVGQVVGWHPVQGRGRGWNRRGCPGEGTPVPRPEPLEVPVS